MNVSFTENAWKDYLYWQNMDKNIVRRSFPPTQKVKDFMERMTNE